MPRSNDEEALVANEELPASTPDARQSVATRAAPVIEPVIFINDEIANAQASFVPATAPYQPDEDFHRVELQNEVLISDAPTDYYSFSYIVFYLLGIGTMTPWNFFITAEDYWMYKFRNTTYNDTDKTPHDLTPMQKSFTCDLALTASISGTVFLILNAIYGHHITLRLKVLGTLFTILILFGLTTVFVEINTDPWQKQFFLITLCTVVLLNISSATLCGGVFGFAGRFPAEYMTALVSGQALGGILTSLAFIAVLAYGADANTTAFVYFIIGSVLILLCIIGYALMNHKPFFKYYLEGGDKYKIITDTPSHSPNENAIVAPLVPNLTEVLSKIYVEAVCIFLIFVVSLSVYPAVTVLMQSENYGHGYVWNDVYFLPVVNYLFFNCGDYFGRLIAGYLDCPRDNPHTVLLLTILRVFYIPLLLCANSNLHHFLPVLVHSDAIFMLLISTFGLTNGYLTNMVLVMAPRSVKKHEKELASSIMAASLSCGIVIGSVLSMCFVQML